MEIDIKGYIVLIDEDDYDRIMALKWYPQGTSNHTYFHHKIYTNGKRYNMLMHRFILGLSKGDGIVVDHINGNTLDNRKCNLRKCTHTENSRNQRIHIDSSTGYKGVSFDKHRNKYKATIRTDGRRINLGYCTTPEEAYATYCEASKKYHGEFGRVK